ncbi:MAG: RrF2 family transcriptional regulator [Saprospiraceae bacterium]
MFSKACEYGIKATIHIGHQSKQGKRVSLKAVAGAIDSPVAFTAKILQSLAKDGIIISTKGSTGGYEILNQKNPKITLLQIVNAIDGDKVYNGCGLGLKQCNAAKPCPLHHQFVLIRGNIKSMLETTTIEDLRDELHEGFSFLKR